MPLNTTSLDTTHPRPERPPCFIFGQVFYVEGPAETQTSIRLASRLVRAPKLGALTKKWKAPWGQAFLQYKSLVFHGFWSSKSKKQKLTARTYQERTD
jgi:hypothetical protein